MLRVRSCKTHPNFENSTFGEIWGIAPFWTGVGPSDGELQENHFGTFFDVHRQQKSYSNI